MASRTQNQIDVVVENARANMFAKMMRYGRDLNNGIADIDVSELTHQSNLIWAASSRFATLDQKSLFCDELNRLGYTVTTTDGLGMLNLFTPSL